LKSTFRIVALSFLFVNLGCAAFPFHSKSPRPPLFQKTKINLSIDPVITDRHGKGFLSNDESVIAYGDEVFRGCKLDCANEVTIQIRFFAETNSKSALFKVWMWASFLTLGIIPLDEITEFTLQAEIIGATGPRQITKELNRHLIVSLVLFPFNIFRSWKKDYFGVQKKLIDQLAVELNNSHLEMTPSPNSH
jgi:hypothetical protein